MYRGSELCSSSSLLTCSLHTNREDKTSSELLRSRALSFLICLLHTNRDETSSKLFLFRDSSSLVGSLPTNRENETSSSSYSSEVPPRILNTGLTFSAPLNPIKPHPIPLSHCGSELNLAYARHALNLNFTPFLQRQRGACVTVKLFDLVASPGPRLWTPRSAHDSLLLNLLHLTVALTSSVYKRPEILRAPLGFNLRGA